MRHSASRRIACWVAAFALASCTSEGASDAGCAHTETFCPGPIPPEPSPLSTPAAPCDLDAGVPGDPCLRQVVCQDNWALTYIDGQCVDGQCTFADAPTLEYCFVGCLSYLGRCARPGSTAP